MIELATESCSDGIRSIRDEGVGIPISKRGAIPSSPRLHDQRRESNLLWPLFVCRNILQEAGGGFNSSAQPLLGPRSP